MHQRSYSWRLIRAATTTVTLIVSGTTGVPVHAEGTAPLPVVPMELPAPAADGIIYLPGPGGEQRPTTINPALQTHLSSYIVDSKSPIAAIVVADVKTGSILAMAQGRGPEQWGGKTHSALHNAFPAASLFKTIVTAAAFEIGDMDPDEPMGLNGGCAQVRPNGDWLKERDGRSRMPSMTLRRAYGSSCNGFFAKVAVNDLGLSAITTFARKFGWEGSIPVDFQMDKSPFLPPGASNSSTHTVGQYAAGFGYVGTSAVHQAWSMLVIANQGVSMPLRLFRDTPILAPDGVAGRVISAKTAQQLSDLMTASIKGGTASSTFRVGKYRKLRELVGGKTGTLTGTSPKGLTTWFAGMAPTDVPQVVVASVVILDERWHIKGHNLAAEGIYGFFEQQMTEATRAAVSHFPTPKSNFQN
jgi:peptidoglycan glycosyltransferase